MTELGLGGILSALWGTAGAQVKQPIPDGDTLIANAAKQYPFISQYNPVAIYSPGKGGGDYAETWLTNDPGDSKRPRPSAIPLNRVGVEVYRPGEFGPSDLAGEFLHVDPYAQQTRQALLQSLSPQQIVALKRNSGDYLDSIRSGEPEQKALQNAMDSAMRGYTVGQWPASANAQMGYTPQQLSLLNSLKNYMVTGKR